MLSSPINGLCDRASSSIGLHGFQRNWCFHVRGGKAEDFSILLMINNNSARNPAIVHQALIYRHQSQGLVLGVFFDGPTLQARAAFDAGLRPARGGLVRDFGHWLAEADLGLGAGDFGGCSAGAVVESLRRSRKSTSAAHTLILAVKVVFGGAAWKLRLALSPQLFYFCKWDMLLLAILVWRVNVLIGKVYQGDVALRPYSTVLTSTRTRPWSATRCSWSLRGILKLRLLVCGIGSGYCVKFIAAFLLKLNGVLRHDRLQWLLSVVIVISLVSFFAFGFLDTISCHQNILFAVLITDDLLAWHRVSHVAWAWRNHISQTSHRLVAVSKLVGVLHH